MIDFCCKCNVIMLNIAKSVKLHCKFDFLYCEHVDSAQYSKNLTAWGMMQDGVCWGLGTSARLIDEIGCGYLPIPTASNYGSNQGGAQGRTGEKRLSLQSMARKNMWPTPTAHNAKECNAPAESNRNTPTLAAQVGGKLNPDWVEWLMGWPIGWTDLKQLAMDKFQGWLHSHGTY